MNYLLSLILFFATAFSVEKHANANPSLDQARQFRFLSMTLRDRPPSVDEAIDFHSGRSLGSFLDEWMASEEFESRVWRFFNDMFGVKNFVFLFPDEFQLSKTAEDVYFLPNKEPCSVADAVRVEAWWLEAGETISICPNSTSATTIINPSQEDQLTCSHSSTTGILASECGCGPYQVLCIPSDQVQTAIKAVRHEFADRALFVYQNDLSWEELFGGSTFIGNRYVFHSYLQTGNGRSLGQFDRTDIATLLSIPLTETTSANFPILGPERSGMVTSIGFMQQYSNFRSRISKLTQALLCKDVDASLNTTNISEFFNPDFTEADLAHGDKEGCASCHFGMDNLGSTLFGWDSSGYYRANNPSSQLGYAFGEMGTGPEFLMSSYTQRADGFVQCMVETFWTDLTGVTWDKIGIEFQEEVQFAAGPGPRSMIETLVRSDLFNSIRTTGTASYPKEDTGTNFVFNIDINPILRDSCSGSSCHDGDSSLGTRYQFIDSEVNFSQVDVERLDDGTMPPASSGKVISEAARKLLISFRKQSD